LALQATEISVARSRNPRCLRPGSLAPKSRDHPARPDVGGCPSCAARRFAPRRTWSPARSCATVGADASASGVAASQCGTPSGFFLRGR